LLICVKISYLILVTNI